MLGKIFTNRILGVLYILALVVGVYMTYAIFTKKFVEFDEVTLRADKTGLQLPSRADVKIRGKFVGEVLDTKAQGDAVMITLGMEPGDIDLIPKNVTAAIFPKTLFGEKYVDLQLPPDPSDEGLAEGDTITQTALPTEVEDVLNDIYPLLRTVSPAEINYTLTALADALEGRGDKLGAGLVTTNNYLTKLNPDLPALIQDLRLLGQTSDVYASVMPQLGQVLRNTVKTAGTLEQKERAVQALFNDVASLSGTTRTFLQNNGDNLVSLSKLGARQARVLATYAPEYPCLTRSIVDQTPLLAEAFRNYTLHINLELLPNQPRGFTTGDSAVYGAKNGPAQGNSLCQAAVSGTYNQGNLIPRNRIPDLDDGVNDASLGKRAGTSYPSGASSSDLGGLLSSTVVAPAPAEAP